MYTTLLNRIDNYCWQYNNGLILSECFLNGTFSPFSFLAILLLVFQELKGRDDTLF